MTRTWFHNTVKPKIDFQLCVFRPSWKMSEPSLGKDQRFFFNLPSAKSISPSSSLSSVISWIMVSSCTMLTCMKPLCTWKRKWNWMVVRCCGRKIKSSFFFYGIVDRTNTFNNLMQKYSLEPHILILLECDPIWQRFFSNFCQKLSWVFVWCKTTNVLAFGCVVYWRSDRILHQTSLSLCLPTDPTW